MEATVWSQLKNNVIPVFELKSDLKLYIVIQNSLNNAFILIFHAATRDPLVFLCCEKQ